MGKTNMMDALELLPVLGNGIWHTTSEARYQGILKSKSIQPEPGIPDSERWHTLAGAKHYPYARSLGGVSLFDFQGFDPESYSTKYPLSSWREFVPFRRQWGVAIWLEVERSKVGDSYISPEALLERWKKAESWGHNLLPLLEAAHIGPISITAISKVLAVSENGYKEIKNGWTAEEQ